MVSGISNLLALVFLPIVIVPGVVGLKIRLYVSHQTDSYSRLDSTVYSWTLSTVSICLLYFWIYLVTGDLYVVPEFLQKNSIENLEVTLIAGTYILHFFQCLLLGALIGAFAYNYIDPPRLSVRETKRDLIFKHIGRGSDVEISTEDGDIIRGYVGKSFNRGEGEGVILSGPKRVCGPKVDGEKHTEDLGQYALVKESEIAYVSVEGEGIEPEKTKDDPDRFQKMVSGVRSEVFPAIPTQQLLSPPRKLFTYILFLFSSICIISFLSSGIISNTTFSSSKSITFSHRSLYMFLMSLLMVYNGGRQLWHAISAWDRSYQNSIAKTVLSSLTILVPVSISIPLFQLVGTNESIAMLLGTLVPCSAIYLTLRHRVHIQGDHKCLNPSRFRLFTLISVSSLMFFFLCLAMYGRIYGIQNDTLMGIGSIPIYLSIILLGLFFTMFLRVIDGGPSKKRPLPVVLYKPGIVFFDTVIISTIVISTTHIADFGVVGRILLPTVGLCYFVGVLVASVLVYKIYQHKPNEVTDDRRSPPKPAV